MNSLLFDDTYRRFLIKRDHLPFSEVAIKLDFRPGKIGTKDPLIR